MMSLFDILLLSSLIIATSIAIVTSNQQLQNNQHVSLGSSTIIKHHQARPTQFTTSALLSSQFDTLAQPKQHLSNQQHNERPQHTYDPPEKVGINLAAPLSDHLSHYSGSPIVMPTDNNDQSQQPRDAWNSILPTRNNYLQSNSKEHTEKEHQQMTTVGAESNGLLSASSLELALRQATGDESVFQPSPAFSAPGHSGLEEWLASSTKINDERRNSINRGTSSALSGVVTTTPATTEQSNIVLNHDGGLDDATSTTVVNSQQSMTREYPTNAFGMFNSAVTNNSNTASGNNLDYSNQVIYEGPATVPPISDSYYFSTAEKDRASNNYNSNERTSSNAWW